MTKKDLAAVIYGRFYRSARTRIGCVITLERIFKKIREELIQQGEVRVHGLGLFKVIWRKPRNCYDPTKGKVVELPGKKVIKFYPDKMMRKAISVANTSRR